VIVVRRRCDCGVCCTGWDGEDALPDLITQYRPVATRSRATTKALKKEGQALLRKVRAVVPCKEERIETDSQFAFRGRQEGRPYQGRGRPFDDSEEGGQDPCKKRPD